MAVLYIHGLTRLPFSVSNKGKIAPQIPPRFKSPPQHCVPVPGGCGGEGLGGGEGPRGVVGELLAVGGVAAVPPSFSSKLIVAIVRIIPG